jgi:aspartate/glutamate racemase
MLMSLSSFKISRTTIVRVHGAEAVILGGTDLVLAFEGHDCGFPVIDSAEAHVEALYQRSIAET